MSLLKVSRRHSIYYAALLDQAERLFLQDFPQQVIIAFDKNWAQIQRGQRWAVTHA